MSIKSNDADEIIPRLWLGNHRASKDEQFIKNKGINVVFNCTKNLEFSPIIPVKYRIPVDDNLQEDEIRNMELWSAEIAFKIVAEYTNGKTILIHCMAGMQRSAASMAMALIVLSKQRYTDVMKLIKSKRQIAFHPSANFIRSIQYFDKKFFNELLPQMINYAKQEQEQEKEKMKND